MKPTDFHTTFALLGELRSLFPSGTCVIALTATATSETLRVVSQRLSIIHPTIVALPPYRENISYRVHERTDLDSYTTSLCSELKNKRMCFPKTVIFVRTYSDCSDMYMLMKQKMGPAFTKPPNYLNVADFTIVDMFSRVLTTAKKDQVLSHFSEEWKTTCSNCYNSIWHGRRLPRY